MGAGLGALKLPWPALPAARPGERSPSKSEKTPAGAKPSVRKKAWPSIYLQIRLFQPESWGRKQGFPAPPDVVSWTGGLERCLRPARRSCPLREAAPVEGLSNLAEAGLQGALPIGSVAGRDGARKVHPVVVPQDRQGNRPVARRVLRGARHADRNQGPGVELIKTGREGPRQTIILNHDETSA